jgi:hypothetical protein
MNPITSKCIRKIKVNTKKKKIERQLTFSLEGTDCVKVEGINVASDVGPGSDISVLVACEEMK